MDRVTVSFRGLALDFPQGGEGAISRGSPQLDRRAAARKFPGYSKGGLTGRGISAIMAAPKKSGRPIAQTGEGMPVYAGTRRPGRGSPNT